ncbi:MAG TPA: VOC family protein [Streptosporangiaceae bacterium]|nr:VOC family protein [Streptosporangiaceae bacterium]
MAHIGLVTLVVADYDEAIGFYVRAAGFDLVEDTVLGDGNRWDLIQPA